MEMSVFSSACGDNFDQELKYFEVEMALGKPLGFVEDAPNT